MVGFHFLVAEAKRKMTTNIGRDILNIAGSFLIWPKEFKPGVENGKTGKGTLGNERVFCGQMPNPKKWF